MIILLLFSMYRLARDSARHVIVQYDISLHALGSTQSYDTDVDGDYDDDDDNGTFLIQIDTLIATHYYENDRNVVLIVFGRVCLSACVCVFENTISVVVDL